MADSYFCLPGARFADCCCDCESEEFQVTVGIAPRGDTIDGEWIYYGLRCPACGLTANYGDHRLWDHYYATLLKMV